MGNPFRVGKIPRCVSSGKEKFANILILFSDDQGWNDIGWNNPKVHTPNLDRLRKQGMAIEGAYSQSKCTPSRAALMTGKMPWKIGVFDDIFDVDNQGALRPKEKLLPEYLKDVGYDTHMYGKWHLGYCDRSLLPISRGFDTFHGFWGGGGTGYFDHIPSQFTHVKDYWVGDQFRDSKLYTTDEFAKDMGEMLDERIRTNDKDPFFTWMAFNAPHAPFEAPDSSILDQYDNLRTRNVLFGMIYRMDLMVGQILKDLERAGELDNTVIIFQSDNGPHMRGS